MALTQSVEDAHFDFEMEEGDPLPSLSMPSRDDNTDEPKDYQLLLHKCNLLEDQKRWTEFAACGLELLSYYFRHVYHVKNLREICLFNCQKARNELKRGTTAESFPRLSVKDDANIKAEVWWSLFLKVGTVLLELGFLGDLRRLALSCAASHRFGTSSHKGPVAENVRIPCSIACLACKEYHLGFEYIRPLCQKVSSSWKLQKTCLLFYFRRMTNGYQKFPCVFLLRIPTAFRC
eukprot:m.65590 g.65590  ORF g.65590 m.65590 type:complete len:234 (+) comp35324_c0_seq2:1491-2192(+)